MNKFSLMIISFVISACNSITYSQNSNSVCSIEKNKWVGNYFFEGFSHLKFSSFDIEIRKDKQVKLVLKEYENPLEHYFTTYKQLSDSSIKIIYLPKAQEMGEITLRFDKECNTYIAGEPVYFMNYLSFEQPVDYSPVK